MESCRKMPRSTRRIPSETKKANSDSSSVTRERLISTISRGCHRYFVHHVLPHGLTSTVYHSLACIRHRSPFVLSCHYAIFSSLLDECFPAIVRLLSEVGYRCGRALFVLLFSQLAVCYLSTDVLSLVVCIFSHAHEHNFTRETADLSMSVGLTRLAWCPRRNPDNLDGDTRSQNSEC